ncbi:MAG: helix-turn-helix domain-containing protein [Candidatus Acidiferrales bacterium]
MSTPLATFSCESFPDIFDRLLRSGRLITVQELADILNLKPKTIYSYAERDLIPHFKIESNVRFRGRDVAEWLRQRDVCGHNRPNISNKWNVPISSHI